MYKEYVKKLPKIELHCHLDGSLRTDSVIEELRRLDEMSTSEIGILKNVSNISEENLYNYIDSQLKVSSNCNSLIEYLKCFELPLAVMQTREAIERFSFEVFEDAYKENVVYLELRFAPILHTNRGLSQEDVIYSAIKGMNRVKEKFGIDGNLILCCMKHLSEESAIDTIEAGKQFLNKGVVAVDLAGAENENFYIKFERAFTLAKQYGYKITIHAGEAASGKNIYDSIVYLHADRIGHGTRLYDNLTAYNLVKMNNIMLEICPTSNIQTKAIIDKHNPPFVDYYNDGLNICINTDNRTVSDINLSDEYYYASQLLGMNIDKYRITYYNTIDASFADDEVKEKLKKLL